MKQKLEMIYYPDPRLRKVAQPITKVTPELREIAGEMFQIMYQTRGIGLAGPQVAYSWRVVVANMTGEQKDEKVFINPVILKREGTQDGEEGCLSLPGIVAQIRLSTHRTFSSAAAQSRIEKKLAMTSPNGLTAAAKKRVAAITNTGPRILNRSMFGPSVTRPITATTAPAAPRSMAKSRGAVPGPKAKPRMLDRSSAAQSANSANPTSAKPPKKSCRLRMSGRAWDSGGDLDASDIPFTPPGET